MPPRKSNVSVGSNGAEEGGESTSKAVKDGLSVEVCVARSLTKFYSDAIFRT
jgi:hypothetical protein